MTIALHGLTTMHCNLLTAIRIARETGFDGTVSCELFSPRHWERDPWEIARECRRRLDAFLEVGQWPA